MALADKIGLEAPPFEVDVERFQLRLFARAIDERRPEYLAVEAARSAGYRDLLAPPTFAFSLAMRPDDPLDLVRLLDLDLTRVLHGEQGFEYIGPICAGDRVRVSRRVVNTYEKRNGALQFYVVEATCHNARDGRILSRTRQTLVQRQELGE